MKLQMQSLRSSESGWQTFNFHDFAPKQFTVELLEKAHFVTA